MAFAAESTYFDKGDGSIIGSFTEKEYGKHFEFSENREVDGWTYPHKVWVSTPWYMDEGWRYAKVLKTVAYILTNDEDGNDVVEKWYIKNHKTYKRPESSFYGLQGQGWTKSKQIRPFPLANLI